MKIIITISLFALSNCVTGQIEPTFNLSYLNISSLKINKDSTTKKLLKYDPRNNPYINEINFLKITPLKLLVIYNPSLEISYERRTGQKFSTQVMASYLLPKSIWDIESDFKSKIRGFRVSLEEKYYFLKLSELDPIDPYISFEFSYLKNNYQNISEFGVRIYDSDSSYNYNTYLDTIGLKKQTFSFSFKVGFQAIVYRLCFDFYAGLGAGYENVVHTNRINPNDDILGPGENWGKYWTISIPLNIRIGYVF